MINHLLLIGIDEYLYQPKLLNCVKDLKDFRDILLDKFYFDELNVVELYNGNATNKNIQDALMNCIASVSADDSLVIYFSGHGEFDKGRGFWIPVEGTHNYDRWLEDKTVISIIEKINCRHIFLIVDACFSNSFFNLGPSKGNRDYSSIKSRWALSSSFEAAYDSDEKGHNGPFARTIIEFLVTVEKDFRVGELIEYVKSDFIANNLQAPQGSALRCKGHMGGEMVFQIKQPTDRRSLKGYQNFVQALKLYKPKSELIEVATYADKTNKIGFQLYQEVDPVVKKLTYYLYLYEGISQNKTLQYLQDNHSQIFKDKPLVILLPKENNATTAAVRLNNVNTKFKPISAFYIDKFIREQCSPDIDFDRSRFLNITNFIQPSFTSHIRADEYIVNWFKEPSQPILVVKGTGGIGKTTFAQFIADKWMLRSNKTVVVFIDSVQIKDALTKVSKFADQLQLYHFYEAFNEISGGDSQKLSEQVFSMNIDAGNILLVVDGLDEVISKIPNFNVAYFLDSIRTASSGLGSTKVVLTCRTFFWDASSISNSDLKVIELEPFNLYQAKEFFTRSLVHKSKVRRAIELAEEFKYPGVESENTFHPYVLDVIKSIIGSEGDPITGDLLDFNSKLLTNSIKNDYILYRVCDRERKRVGQISVDSQIKFFLYFATHKRGIIPTEQFKTSIEEALGTQIDSSKSEAFKAHPFLKTTETSVSFKYDFLTDLFKSIYLALKFDFQNDQVNLDLTLLELIKDNCWFGSPIIYDTVNRIKKWDEFELIVVGDLISRIWAFKDLTLEKRRKIVAHLFNLCLSISHKFSSNSIIANTTLMKAIFENKNGSISALSIDGIKHEHALKFDFSGLVFTECYIVDYGSFWNCKFDGITKFIKCHFSNLKTSGANQTLSKEHFIDCIYDTDIDEVFRRIEEKSMDRIQQTTRFLGDFFHLFYSGGRLGRQWEYKIIKPRFSGISQNRFDYNETIKILKGRGVLYYAEEKDGTKMAIEDRYKEDVLKFTNEGTMSTIINILVRDFIEK
ncbi:MAG: caspase family protein [Bacteroidota bacterium]